ncbi:HAMP domain-containing histidine kinase [Ralstonia sp. UBA689]|uniref:sensor histidine kinase n=1 Tax=Ralstonia sp. UBA689 TaxID=1947373 RepID=UPI0025D1EC80|nr:HAMP domain-containing histidine kinase [Ralstonia sp. UBA689]
MGRLLAIDYAAYKKAIEAQSALQLVNDALLAYYAVSAERGPANALLGRVPESERAARLEALTRARHSSDAALDALAQRFGQRNPPHCSQAQAAVLRVKQQLIAARATIDQLHARPTGTLSAHEISDGIAEMIGVAISFNFILNRAALILEQYESAASGDARQARQAAELREYAGRLGSLLTATFATEGTISPKDQNSIHRTEGRIDQLREQLFGSLEINQGDFTFRDIVGEIRGVYFDHAYRIIHFSMGEHKIRNETGRDLTPATFADQYVPAMAPIVALRDHMLAKGQEKLKDSRLKKRNRLLQTGGCCGIILMLIAGAMVYFGTHYVSPLQGLVDALLSMSDEGLPSALQLAAVSHDIQSPQSAILALLEMSRTNGTYNKSPEIFGKIEAYAMRTLSMVEEFIALGQLQSSRQKSFRSIDLHGVVLDACDSVAVAALARRTTVIVNADEGPLVVRGERGLLVRAVVNLLDNAVKYSPDGSKVHCRISREGKTIMLEVQDAGYGIRGHDMQHLFRRFRRFSAPGQPRVKGSGLGLVFVRSVVRRMRGDITCQSEVGRGSTFTIWFPASKSL